VNKALNRDGAMGFLPQGYHLFTKGKVEQVISYNINVITGSMPEKKTSCCIMLDIQFVQKN